MGPLTGLGRAWLWGKVEGMNLLTQWGLAGRSRSQSPRGRAGTCQGHWTGRPENWRQPAMILKYRSLHSHCDTIHLFSLTYETQDWPCSSELCQLLQTLMLCLEPLQEAESLKEILRETQRG